MITVRCHLPQIERMSDDLCHPWCLTVAGLQTQAEMFALQKEILAALKANEAATRVLVAALERQRSPA